MATYRVGGTACSPGHTEVLLDKALAFTMVTANGKEAVRASANENKDLFGLYVVEEVGILE